MAYAIGRHVGPAVTRNRIRRRLRAIVRDSALTPGAYLVLAGPGAATAGYDELAQHLRAAVAP
ncbi:MAG: Ribonuclease [Solirubrobacteraceae bacterium]|nr:Ribonuclease [Solirubrobacteraceae bacterium]